MKALLFAAGLGTRLQPITNDIPKALVPVNGKTLLERNITYLKSYGITDFVINVHHFHLKIKDFLEQNANFGVNIEISDESHEVLETGGGLKFAEQFLSQDDFLVMNVDILTDCDIYALQADHRLNKPLATLAVTEREATRALLFSEMNQLCGWKNLLTNETKIAIENEQYINKSFSGIHIISPKIFPLITTEKHSIIDDYLTLASSHTIRGFDHSGGILIDVGKHETLQKACDIFV